MFAAIIPGGMLLAFAFFIRSWNAKEPDDWHKHFSWRRVPLVEGGNDWGLLMRRQINGEWEYRRSTEEEIEDGIFRQDF